MEEYLGMMKWLQELCDEKGIQLLPVAEKVIKLLEDPGLGDFHKTPPGGY